MTRTYKTLAIIFSSLFLLSNLALPMLSQAVARPELSETPPIPIEVILEDPTTYHPPVGTCEETYWYEIPNDRGHNAYLTLNVSDPADSTNWAEWYPTLTAAGYYRVEAYITWHDPITWCSESAPTIYTDTADARYTITHAFGDTTVSRTQTSLANEWLDLGEYFFNAGSDGKVVLTDLNGEQEFSTTVSFSAMRFTWTREPPTKRMLPMLNRGWVATPTLSSTPPPPWVGVQADPGFDACHMGPPSTLQVWWDSSPYKIVGLYLGGISYPVDPPVECSVITAEWVQQVRSQGWTFIPTWAGPQAPCVGYKHPMDEDPVVTYQQGRDEANAASQAAYELGLTNYGFGGTIIYYDMEAYGGISDECMLAVEAFMNGWTERLHELGNRSGMYSTSCSLSKTDWLSHDNPPDDMWLAYWTEEEYDPDQTVYGLPCFSDSLYTNHQRIKQYAGGHDESWGGKQLQIDSDVADSEVAMPVITPTVGNSMTVQASLLGESAIQQAGWLTAAEGWVVSSNRLYLTEDGGASWQEQGLPGIQHASFLADGTAWAAGSGMLYRREAGQAGWQAAALPEEVSGWRVIQVGYQDLKAGWLVLQMPTSTIFSIARLLRTSDGGLSWQLSDLPFASEITWTGAGTGWISGGISGRGLYRTLDGGKSWQEAALPGSLADIKAPLFLGAVQAAEDGLLTLSAAVSQVKIPYLHTYTSQDAGKTWLLTGSLSLHEGAPFSPLPQSSALFADGAHLRSLKAASSFDFAAPVVQLGSQGSGLLWAVTRQGTCQGEKDEPGFSCSLQDTLWLSTDAGVTWRLVLP